ncbi:MAG: hypothetical protein HC880_20265 [Bacteroidia bacterium]|nr:hypothetical protein [Bacteroidia bacterium]
MDDQSNTWIVVDGQLHCLRPSEMPPMLPLKALVVSLQNRAGEYMPVEKIRLPYTHEEMGLRFQLAFPNFLNEQATQYQYRLEGLNKEWSAWSGQSQAVFTYLPSGYYRLRIRAKDALGQVSPETVLSLRIVPPFWQTWWFYTFQTLVLGGLVFASYFFNKTRQDTQLSHVLTFVSIITIFEFLILLVEPYTDQLSGGVPFFKLGMNILLAMSLNPAEKYVKVWMHKRREVQPKQVPHS